MGSSRSHMSTSSRARNRNRACSCTHCGSPQIRMERNCSPRRTTREVFPIPTCRDTNTYFSILCNTSGSGKTRLLLEGLAKNWGFYFVASHGFDKMGSLDIDTVTQRMCIDTAWVRDIFASGSAKAVRLASTVNENVATKAILKVLLARWSIFRLFIEEARNQGKSVEDTKADWLNFQIFPPSIVGKEPFMDLVDNLHGATLEDLPLFRNKLNPQSVLGPDFNKDSDRFFYVIDEIQLAGERYASSFCNEDGTVERPVLRPMSQTLTTDSTDVTVIVSGTGFSHSDFHSVLVSSVGKVDRSWPTEYSTGDFTDPEIQYAYIKRYLPPSYLNSRSGIALISRMQRWLCGRYVTKSHQAKTHLICLSQIPIYGKFHPATLVRRLG
jgi:hypothetical protein